MFPDTVLPDYGHRRERVLAKLDAQSGARAFLVTHRANVTWLTGFTGSNGAVLLTGGHALLATDSRYRDQGAHEAVDVELVIDRALGIALLARASELGTNRIAYEADHVCVGQFDTWQLNTAMMFVGTGSLIESLRIVKDAGEIELLARAGAISTEALAEVTATVRVGMTERYVARRLEAAMAAAGADDRAFATIVASGPNSAVPHHQPTSRAIESGDLLKIDFGARIGGYHADCTRTYVVGADPAPWQSEIFQIVVQAAAVGRAALRPGVSYAEVDSAARDVIAQAGYGQRFTHGLGHGVGLEIHEAPLFCANCVGSLAAGVVATVEPGIYLPGQGGVRIEDTCLVTGGQARELTTASRELQRIG